MSPHSGYPGGTLLLSDLDIDLSQTLAWNNTDRDITIPGNMCSMSAATWLLRGKKTLNCWSDCIFDLYSKRPSTLGKEAWEDIYFKVWILSAKSHSDYKDIMLFHRWIFHGTRAKVSVLNSGKITKTICKNSLLKCFFSPKYCSKWRSLSWRRQTIITHLYKFVSTWRPSLRFKNHNQLYLRC